MSTAQQRVQGLIYYVTNKGLLVANKAMNYGTVRSTLHSSCLINDKPLEQTFSPFWYFVDANKGEGITSYKEKDYDKTVLKGFELQDKSMFYQDKIPLTLSLEDVESDYDEDGDLIWTKYNNIRSLYKEVCEVIKGEYKEVPFKAECLGVVEGDISEPIKAQFSIRRTVDYKEKSVPIDISSVVHYSELDTILTPEFALHTKPCSISSQQSYEIIRTFVKDNIDPKMACITSDYNFCFTIKKKVGVKPWVKSTEIKTRSGRSYATPKFKTQTVDHIQVEIFEMTHEKEKYKGYTPIKGFTGESLEDLVNNIKSYLQDLIEYINMPVHQCQECGGTGHIIGKHFDMNKR